MRKFAFLWVIILISHYYDILNSEYEMTLPAGVKNRQHEITSVNETLNAPQWSGQLLEALQNNLTQTLIVINPDLVPIALISLYDLGGKLIFNTVDIRVKEQYQFSTSALSGAIYIAKVMAKNHQDFGRKISVYNGQ